MAAIVEALEVAAARAETLAAKAATVRFFMLLDSWKHVSGLRHWSAAAPGGSAACLEHC